MHKAWLAAVAAATLVATSSVAFAHGHHGGDGSDHAAAAATVRLAVGAQTSTTMDEPERDSDDAGQKTALTTVAGTVTAAGSGSFSVQETTSSGSQTVVVTYGASTVIRPASATVAVGDRVEVRGSMTNGALAATEIAVAAPAPAASAQGPVHPVHGTLAASVTLTVQTSAGSQTVTLPAGTKVEVNPGGLHVEIQASGDVDQDQGKQGDGNGKGHQGDD